ncbi:hypothetical protein BJX96DRAFT_6687 [Aspergillus floccosus]
MSTLSTTPGGPGNHSIPVFSRGTASHSMDNPRLLSSFTAVAHCLDCCSDEPLHPRCLCHPHLGSPAESTTIHPSPATEKIKISTPRATTPHYPRRSPGMTNCPD